MLAFFGTTIGPFELCVVLVIALLLFGRRLPEVMRNLGKGVVEFKRGVRGIEDQIDDESTRPAAPPPEQHQAVTPPSQDAEADAPSEKAET